VIVVGAGPAGVAAAAQCLRLGIVPLIVDRTGAAGGLVENAYCVENYPGIEKPLRGPELAERLRAHLARFGLAVERAEVTAIAREGDDYIVDGDPETMRARAVILASGTEPVRLGISNERECEDSAVFYDVRSLLRRHPNPRSVVVVGGGEAACDYALSLSASDARVTMAVRSNRLKARGRLADAVRRSSAVRVLFETVCESVGISPTAVRLRGAAGDTEESETDAVLVAVGRRSAAAALLESMGAAPPAAENGPLAGLFVAGDARRGGLGQVGMAVGDGMRAAAAAVSFSEGGP
jgi:thioredoxin reductase (NADPH)